MARPDKRSVFLACFHIFPTPPPNRDGRTAPGEPPRRAGQGGTTAPPPFSPAYWIPIITSHGTARLIKRVGGQALIKPTQLVGLAYFSDM